MKNAEQQLKWAREQALGMHAGDFKVRLQETLRVAWKTRESQLSHDRIITKKPLSLKRAFGFAATGLLVIIFATFSAAKVGEVQKENVSYLNTGGGGGMTSELGLYYGEGIGLSPSSRQREIISSVFEPFVDDRAYRYGDGKQLFDESIGYTMKVRGESDDEIGGIRTEATNLGGAVVRVQRYDDVGEIMMRLEMPQETITVFEAYLESLALDDTFRRSDYAVENVSQKVVTIEKDIAREESALKRFQDQLARTSSSTIRRRIEKNIAEAERSLKERNAERARVIEKYDMVKVSVRITEKKSFWSGAYWQYDRETVGGAILYQLSRGVFMIINTFGFIISLLFYGMLAVIVWKLGKRLFGRRYPDEL